MVRCRRYGTPIEDWIFLFRKKNALFLQKNQNIAIKWNKNYISPGLINVYFCYINKLNFQLIIILVPFSEWASWFCLSAEYTRHTYFSVGRRGPTNLFYIVVWMFSCIFFSLVTGFPSPSSFHFIYFYLLFMRKKKEK